MNKSTEDISWIERARKLLDYRREANEFVQRVGSQLPIDPNDSEAVSLLWVEADFLDELICSLLNEMDSGLLQNSADELDITRGATMRPSPLENEEIVYYECTWSLTWGDGLGILVVLAIDSRSKIIQAQVRGLKSKQIETLRFPISETILKEGLTPCYVSEATADDTGQEIFDSKC